MDSKLVSIAASALRAASPASELSAKEQLRFALTDGGFAPEDIARLLRNVAYNAEKDSDVLKATEIAAKLLGVSEEKAAIPTINILIQGSSEGPSIFLPPSPSSILVESGT